MCQQLYLKERTSCTASIFISLLNVKYNETECDASKDAVILESTLKLNILGNESFYGSCIGSGAQLTVIGSKQADIYMKKYGSTVEMLCSTSRIKHIELEIISMIM